MIVFDWMREYFVSIMGKGSALTVSLMIYFLVKLGTWLYKKYTGYFLKEEHARLVTRKQLYESHENIEIIKAKLTDMNGDVKKAIEDLNKHCRDYTIHVPHRMKK